MAAGAAAFAGTDTDLVETMLAEYGAATRARLAAYLPAAEPRSYLYDLIADYPRRGGKMLRSSLCLAMARACGAAVDDAMPTAVAIELLHNALLVHDDIEDASDERRGTPTLHRLHGVALALNAGDAMGLLSLRPLKDNFRRLGIRTSLRILEETERVAWESAEGQALELGWQRDNRTDLADADYLGMVLQKTCWLTAIHPLRVGCLIGARGRLPLDPLVRIGFFYGAAFQIQDDVLNLEGAAAYGKEIGGDLYEGKRTLILINALGGATIAERRRIAKLLARPRSGRTAPDIAWLRDLIDRTGALHRARSIAHGLAGAALLEFDRFFAALPDSRDRQFIRGLLTWVMQRAH